MIFEIEAKKDLYVAEWNTVLRNNLNYTITVDIGHNELMTTTITITDMPVTI